MTLPTPGTTPDASLRERIDVNNDEQLRQWADKLDSTPMQIKDAVQAVGDDAVEVESHLKGVRSSTNSDRVAEAGGPGSDAGR